MSPIREAMARRIDPGSWTNFDADPNHHNRLSWVRPSLDKADEIVALFGEIEPTAWLAEQHLAESLWSEPRLLHDVPKTGWSGWRNVWPLYALDTIPGHAAPTPVTISPTPAQLRHFAAEITDNDRRLAGTRGNFSILVAKHLQGAADLIESLSATVGYRGAGPETGG